jgi:hypothetical protein
VVQQRLSLVHRVWLARIGKYPHNALHRLNFRLVRIRRVSNVWVLLYERRCPRFAPGRPHRHPGHTHDGSVAGKAQRVAVIRDGRLSVSQDTRRAAT